MRLLWCKRSLGFLFLLAVTAPLLASRLPTTALGVIAKDRFSGSTEWIRIVTLLVAACLAVTLSIAYLALDYFPNSGDEYAYLFQAEIFGQGKLWAHAPPLGEMLVPFRTWVFDDRWASQYPPGWPAIIAMFGLASIPATAVNPLLSATVAVMTAYFVFVRTRSRLAAAAAVLALTWNPFFLFNGASFHSHMAAAMFLLIFCGCLPTLEHDFRVRTALIAGLAIAAAFATRYYVVAGMLPCLIFWSARVSKKIFARTLLFGTLGAAPVILLLLGYQYELTGTPLRSTYSIISVPESSPGLSGPTLIRGMELTGYRLLEFVTWTSPAHLIAPLLLLAIATVRRELRAEDLVFPGFVIAYVAFPDLGGNRYGPRYYFDAFPILVTSTAVGVFRLINDRGPRLLDTLQSRILAHAVISAAVYGAVAATAAIPAYRSQVALRQEPFRVAEEFLTERSILIIKRTIKDGLIQEDFARNRPRLDQRVLYARYDASIEDLSETYPDRGIYIYEKARFNEQFQVHKARSSVTNRNTELTGPHQD